MALTVKVGAVGLHSMPAAEFALQVMKVSDHVSAVYFGWLNQIRVCRRTVSW